MHGLLDEILVGGALLASIVYAVWALGPRTWKRGKRSGACGGCDGCGSAAAAAKSSGSPDPEVRIPVSTIGKR